MFKIFNLEELEKVSSGIRIGRILKLIRIMKNQTIRNVSKNTGLSELTIQKLENGQTNNPAIGTITKIAKFYEVPIDKLFQILYWNEEGKEIIESLFFDYIQ